ncbi:glycosyltransferase family 2 protein [Wenzhouxiangella sp. EGI_FJ10305]|uniref:glycosyltransferase family 2 protein n=1 Tax=Wenzhouxiangella sp. EGI_FJ10305 TaxID=3243768 RepID=UPI0035D63C31
MTTPGEQARIAVVVLNYHGAEDTVACLESLAQLDPSPAEVVVIDNASADDSVAVIREAFPDAELVCNRENLGFGAGQNAVLGRLIAEGFDWVWLVNNDLRVRSDALAHLLEHADRHPGAGVIGTCILDLDHPGDVLAIGGGTVNHWLGRSSHIRRRGRRPDYITGASMLLNCRALEEVGVFDAGFFMYWEDADLCRRLEAAGWSIQVAESAVVWHRQSASVGGEGARKDRLINASAVGYFSRHGPLGGWPAIVSGSSLRVVRRLVAGRWSAARAVWQGTLEGLRRFKRSG